MKGMVDDGGLTVVVVVVDCRVTAACNVTCGVSVGS
jgi:predicted small secreted protein